MSASLSHRRISGPLQVHSSAGVSPVSFQNPAYPESHIVPVRSLSERRELRLLHHAVHRCNSADQKSTAAAKYVRIGENKLWKLAEENPAAGWVIMNGNRIQIKRKQFEKIIDTLDAI